MALLAALHDSLVKGVSSGWARWQQHASREGSTSAGGPRLTVEFDGQVALVARLPALLFCRGSALPSHGHRLHVAAAPRFMAQEKKEVTCATVGLNLVLPTRNVQAPTPCPTSTPSHIMPLEWAAAPSALSIFAAPSPICLHLGYPYVHAGAPSGGGSEVPGADTVATMAAMVPIVRPVAAATGRPRRRGGRRARR